MLTEGTFFPFDCGFNFLVLSEGGDLLNTLVLLDVAVATGCLLTARPIGVIEAEQHERSGEGPPALLEHAEW